LVTVKAQVKQGIHVARDHIAAANLRSSSALRFTRDAIARPGSDWGLEGIGTVFREKRTALRNLTVAARQLDASEAALRQAAGQVGFGAMRTWRIGLQLASARAAHGAAREALRGTRTFWDRQQELTYSAAPDDRRVLEAVLADGPGPDQQIIDAHLRARFPELSPNR
jgi:hypothetical protein